MANTYEVSVPQLGKVDTVNLVEWKVAPGDRVSRGTEIAEIETMKSTFSVEAPKEGTIDQLLVEQGDEAVIGDSLATIRTG